MERPSYLTQVRKYYTDEEMRLICDGIEHDLTSQNVAWMYENELPYQVVRSPFDNPERQMYLFLHRPIPVVMRGSRLAMKSKYRTKSAFPSEVINRWARIKRLTVLHYEDDGYFYLVSAKKAIAQKHNVNIDYLCVIRNGYCYIDGKVCVRPSADKEQVIKTLRKTAYKVRSLDHMEAA